MNTVKEDPKPQVVSPETKPDESVEEPEPKVEESQETPKEEAPVRPEYDRFLKMVQVGVPLQAVKLKVSIEGLDPNVLEEIINK